MINLDTRTFLVKFKFQSTNYKFLVNKPEDLKLVLERYDKNGIEYIKEFDVVKMRPIRVSKDTIRAWAGWHTETDLYLSNHYYFK